jgi:hypothetical protein
MTADTVYGNPQPYANIELERSALHGRLAVARFIEQVHRASGANRVADIYRGVIDELLGHLSQIEVRVASAMLEVVINADPT